MCYFDQYIFVVVAVVVVAAAVVVVYFALERALSPMSLGKLR